MSQDRPFVWRSHWKCHGWAHHLDEVGSQGITSAGLTVLTRLMETQTWWLPVSAHQEVGRLNKETMDSASTSVWDNAAPPALTLKLDNSVAPCMSLMPFRLLPQHWTERVSPSASKSSYRPFKRDIWDSSHPRPHSATISAGFHSQKLWGILFPALESWAGEPRVGLGPLTLLGGPLQPR